MARPTAALLAEAGLDVLVVEEGPWVEQGSVRAVLARADGPSVPLGRRHGGARPSVDRLHRGPVRRWRDRDQQRAVPPTVGGDARPLAIRLGRSPTSPTTSSSPPATRWRRRCRFRPCRADTHRRANDCDSAPSDFGWDHDEIPRWMTYPERRRRHGGAPGEHDPDVPAAGVRGRRPNAVRPPRRSAWSATTAAAFRAELTAPDGIAGHDRLRARLRVRRCDPDTGTPAALGSSRPRRRDGSPFIRP